MFKFLWILNFLSFICSLNNLSVSTTDIHIQISNYNRGTPEKRNLQVFIKKLRSKKGQTKQLQIGNRNAVWAKPRVIGGWEAKLGEVPYSVSIKRYRKTGWRSFCGGSIIKDDRVLTAAHCIASHREMSLCLARLGVQNLPMIGDFSHIFVVAGSIDNKIVSVPQINDDQFGQWRKIERIAVPDEYEFPLHDISVITVKHPFVFNKLVAPIPLASQDVDFDECIIAGYGNTYYDTDATPLFSEVLKYSKVKVMTVSSCNEALLGETIPFVCTDDTYKTASALGDSGGPLVCKKPKDPNDQGFGVLVGVVCAGTNEGQVSLYSKVVLHKNYITAGLATNVKSNALLLTLLNVYLLIFCVSF